MINGIQFYAGWPTMIMLCGLPGSGKSTFANEIKKANSQFPISIHSSDALRQELYGDASQQGDNGKLFEELHRRIREDLKAGRNIIYDATNIKSKERVSFLNGLDKIQCHKVCIVLATEYDACVRNNHQRMRQVPDEVIRRMYLNFTPPHYGEGFDQILYRFRYLSSDGQNTHTRPDYYTIGRFFEIANDFDQENSHHTLTLGGHCTKCGEYIQQHAPDNYNLLVAALLHDVGKLYTKTRRNIRGKYDRECHYYQHHCCGAYESMFYLDDGIFTEKDICYISTMIYYHMHPYCSWKQSEKAKKKDENLLGEWFFDVLLLHDADDAAH